MDRVYKNIFISSVKEARDIRFIKKNKIKYILSMIGCDLDGIPCERVIIKLHDHPFETYPFEEVNKTLDEWTKRDDGNILIHCYAGISRAVTALAGFMIHEGDLDVEAVIEKIKDKRPIACPNYGFRIQLMILADQKKNEKHV